MDPFALPLVQRQLEVSSGKTKAVLWLGLLLSSVRALWSELRSKVLFIFTVRPIVPRISLLIQDTILSLAL
ncbi:hypothetical protein LINPERHAP2_LOCUS403 [Linum perenne]